MYNKAFHNRDLSDLSILITGGAGFIGSHIAEYLLQHNVGKVRVMDNFLTGHRHNIDLFIDQPNYEFFEGDIRDPEQCLKACEGMDIVCHQAALGSVPRSVEDPIASNACNIDGFLNMLDAARRKGIKRFVYASSSSVYGDEKTLPKVEAKVGNVLSPYAVTKKANELYANLFAQLYGMETVGFRYFNVFGPRQDPYGPYAAVIPLFIDRLQKGEPVYIDGDGGQTRDFTFVSNVVQINVKAMLTDRSDAFGLAYNVAVGSNFSVLDLYKRLSNLLGVDAEAVHRDSRPGDIRDSLATIDLAKDKLGYEPEVNFEDGLATTVDFFKAVFAKSSV